MISNEKSFEISVKYKNDEAAKNKLIELIIDFLIENAELLGDLNGGKQSKRNGIDRHTNGGIGNEEQ